MGPSPSVGQSKSEFKIIYWPQIIRLKVINRKKNTKQQQQQYSLAIVILSK